MPDPCPEDFEGRDAFYAGSGERPFEGLASCMVATACGPDGCRHCLCRQGPPIRSKLGDSAVFEDTRLVVPPGSVVICGHHTYHRATRSVAGAPWRAMFKLNAARVSEPAVPLLPAGTPASWASAEAAAPHHQADDRRSAAHHGVWEGVWGWLHGRQLAAAEAFQSLQPVEVLAATLVGSESELDCVEAGCSLGLLAQAGDGAALAALVGGFGSRRERSRRASMHGLGLAGDAAVRLSGAVTAIGNAQRWDDASGCRH